MFTGIISHIATLSAKTDHGQDVILALDVGMVAKDLNLGESIAIDGVCLSITGIAPLEKEKTNQAAKTRVTFQASAQTLKLTTLGGKAVGNKLHWEAACRLGQKLDGHWILGHIDTTSVILERLEQGPSLQLTLGLPPLIVPLVTRGGSIAVDGVSLTVIDSRKDRFSVNIINWSRQHTHFNQAQVGAMVNIEADMIARYTAHILECTQAKI